MTALPEKRSLLLIVSGPAGSGKTTLCERMLAEIPEVRRIVTATSRPPREGEKEGADYYFFSRDEFERKIAGGAFFEWAEVHGNYYGCLKAEVRDKLVRQRDLLLNIDVQGAETFRRAVESDSALKEKMVTVFVTPASLEVVRERLTGRGQDAPEEIERRVENAAREIEEWVHYDYCLISRDREHDFTALRSIYVAEGIRNPRKGRM